MKGGTEREPGNGKEITCDLGHRRFLLGTSPCFFGVQCEVSKTGVGKALGSKRVLYITAGCGQDEVLTGLIVFRQTWGLNEKT